ncbi:MAG TPA: 5-bromo-4-chloroindolyl phosphate hydrolysis family protein [Rectinemataceae bacterium]|nr:5-bromo-4-chloroindolyl phosphate hydrolysis family protein [Rectinemataceae bacterium]
MSPPESRSRGGIAAGVVGALLFLLFYLVLDSGLLLSLACAAGGVLAGLLLFGSGRRLSVKLDGVDEGDLREAISAGESKLAELKTAARSIHDKTVAAKVEAIASVVARVLGQIRREPKNLRNARQFLGYYLDATIKIVGRYVYLSSQNLKDGEIQTSLRRVEDMLETIRSAFEKQLARLMADDVLDLDTELGLLESTIKMEGLGDGPKQSQ